MSSTPVPSAREHGRERRKRLTRAALRAATLELGLAQGLGDVGVEAIAERAGVSPRTFFNYFATKEDAALLELFAFDDEQLAGLARGSGPDVWDELGRLFGDDVARATAETPELSRYLLLHQQNPTLQARQLAVFTAAEARLSAAIEQRLSGAGPAGLASLMAGAGITAVRVGLAEWTREGRLGPVRPWVESGFSVLAPAFRGLV